MLCFRKETNTTDAIEVLPDPLTNSEEVIVVVVTGHGRLMLTPVILIDLPQV
jgi:hypothetical protein